MSAAKKKWLGMAAIGTAIAGLVARLRRGTGSYDRPKKKDRSQKPAVSSDVR